MVTYVTKFQGTKWEMVLNSRIKLGFFENNVDLVFPQISQQSSNSTTFPL